MLYQARNLKNSETTEVIGTISFTKRELDILACLLSGKSAKGIGPLLSIAPRTVETHVQKIMAKLNCNSKEHIIEFIEHSGHFRAFKQRYIALLKEKDPNISIESLNYLPKNSKPLHIFYRYNHLTISMIILGALVLCSAAWIGVNGSSSTASIRSDLLIPDQSYLLNRPQLLKQIDAKFRSTDAIQTVALVGIGGSGKTTLARQYLHSKQAPVIWECDGETQDALIHSFAHLAYALSKTKEEKRELEWMKKLDNSQEYVKRLLYFLRQKLKEKKQWYLLFDNVESFEKVQPFLPRDARIWGVGKMILTTRNPYLKPNAYIDIDKILPVLPLTDPEKLDLFTKILARNKAKDLIAEQRKQVQIFLKHIPPFPSDVSIAASYIKNTQVSYPDYLQRIQLTDGEIESNILRRPQLIKTIQDKINKQNGIQVVTLFGPGGSGKTTVARQCARMQKSSFLWEFNAETPELLLAAFEEFAYMLCETKEEEHTLEQIKNSELSPDYTKKLLSFVQKKLKNRSNWCLIFDNLGASVNIQPFFPSNINDWGAGKVFVTTRHMDLLNNGGPLSNTEVIMKALDHKEKQVLFTKIMNCRLTPAQEKQLDMLLQHLPPYPLDVSIAAYYLKNSGVSYQDYLDAIQTLNNGLGKAQVEEVNWHVKTRYGIISCALKELIELYPDCIGLLLLIGIIENQNISKSLELYKKKALSDQFIHHLCQYSLLSYDLKKDCPQLSVHRSTQEMIRQYLNQRLNAVDKEKYMDKVIDVLEQYSDIILNQADVPGIRTFLRNIVTCSNHISLLSPLHRGLLDTHIGRLSYRIGAAQSKEYTEKQQFSI